MVAIEPERNQNGARGAGDADETRRPRGSSGIRTNQAHAGMVQWVRELEIQFTTSLIKQKDLEKQQEAQAPSIKQPQKEQCFQGSAIKDVVKEKKVQESNIK